MVEGALNPEEPLSAEHWLNSIGLATMVLGLRNVKWSEIGVATTEEVVQLNGIKMSNLADDVAEGVGKGTVCDNIIGTADNMQGTEIPATFKVKLDDSISYNNPSTHSNVLWTNANATEHMGEYISRWGEESWTIGIRSQSMLESYSASLNEAMKELTMQTPGRYFGTYGNWELGINTETGVVYHAKMLK